MGAWEQSISGEVMWRMPCFAPMPTTSCRRSSNSCAGHFSSKILPRKPKGPEWGALVFKTPPNNLVQQTLLILFSHVFHILGKITIPQVSKPAPNRHPAAPRSQCSWVAPELQRLNALAKHRSGCRIFCRLLELLGINWWFFGGFRLRWLDLYRWYIYIYMISFVI